MKVSLSENTRRIRAAITLISSYSFRFLMVTRSLFNSIKFELLFLNDKLDCSYLLICD